MGSSERLLVFHRPVPLARSCRFAHHDMSRRGATVLQDRGQVPSHPDGTLYFSSCSVLRVRTKMVGRLIRLQRERLTAGVNTS